jgi:hypothetical protein
LMKMGTTCITNPGLFRHQGQSVGKNGTQGVPLWFYEI